MTLKKYREQRVFEKTAEPEGILKKGLTSASLPLFCIQKHNASKLHYDSQMMNT